MSNLRKAAEMALERLERTIAYSNEEMAKIDAAKHALRQALAQPEREWVDISTEELIEALKAANLPSIFSYRMACKVALDIAKDKNYTITQQPDEFCTATTEELMKDLGCSDEKAKEIHDKVEALAQPEQYDQTSLELCNVCGWKAVIPDEGCLVCARKKQEPVAWIHNRCGHLVYLPFMYHTEDTPLYTAPPKRGWVGLTDEDLASCLPGAARIPPGWRQTAQAIEAKLKEKNT